MRKSIYTAFALFLLLFVQSNLFAQNETDKLTKTILSKDSIFWQAYNQCNPEMMKQFLDANAEFYHDKGGITLGADNLVTSIKKNLCSNDNFRLRREAVNGTVNVFPLQNNGAIYGAIISGEHYFYILEKGKPERLDGLAKFTHVWLLKDNEWKMTRILSYDHGPASRRKK